MTNIIKHANIIYMPYISELGGIETYVYEMIKKYHDLDIAVVSKKCDYKQAKRIKKYCRLYIHTNEKINCKVAIINYDTSIIKYINKEAKIYQTIHADYSQREMYNYKLPSKDKRITDYIAITDFLKNKVKELLEINNVIMSYNPLTIEKTEKPIIIVTASRLHQTKGKDIMQLMVNELDKQKINWLWFVITNDIGGIEHPNMIFIQNRLDIDKFISLADYGALFSKSEACSYFINEMLYRNIPMLVTPLPYLKEIGVEDGKNAYLVDFDGSNIKEVVNKIKKIPKFNFKKLEDKYRELLFPSKSFYQKQLAKKYKLKAIKDFSLSNWDSISHICRKNLEHDKKGFIYTEDTFECDFNTKNYLTGDNLNKTIVAQVIKEIK